MNIQIYTMNIQAGVVMSAYVVLYTAIAFALYYFKRRAVLSDLIHYAMHFHVTVNQLASELEMPISILDLNGTCLWENRNFHDKFTAKLSKNHTITDAIPALTMEHLPKEAENNSISVRKRDEGELGNMSVKDFLALLFNDFSQLRP